MPAELTHSLKPYNTFGVDYFCTDFKAVTSKSELIQVTRDLFNASKPFLVIGGGSNILLTDNYLGTVVQVCSKGIEVTEDDAFYYLAVEAGENWHQLVEYCLSHGIAGLENLALIPGTVGAAPIQNIGAYGVEFTDVCDWVEFVDLNGGEVKRYQKAQCQFAYRESVFKSELKSSAVITRVCIKLAKRWVPCLSYGPLKQFDPFAVTAKDIFECICQLRRDKLPDPALIGNAGSFFKNPVVSEAHYQTLSCRFPNVVGYPLGNGQVKLAAGWLIDNAGLKGKSVGDASVHHQQALVLINQGNASGTDIAELAKQVIATIKQRFNVSLEAEPRVIGANGEKELLDG